MPKVTKTVFDRDRFHSQRLIGPARAAGQVLDALQDHPAEAQVAGLAVAFVRLCTAAGMREGDVIAAAHRMMHSSPQFDAVSDYLKGEVLE